MSTNFLHLIPRCAPIRQGGQPESVSDNDLHRDGRLLLRVAQVGDVDLMPFRIQVRRTLDAVEAKRQALRREWEAQIRQEFPSMRLCAGYRDREAALRELASNLLDVLNQAGPRGAA